MWQAPLKNNPLVSIIILNYNGQRFVDKCLQSIEQQTYQNREVIFFDNLSTDGSAQRVQENWSKVKVIAHPINLLFAKGNNEAAKHAKGEYFFFLNNDAYLHPRCLEELVQAREVGIGVYAPKMMDYEGKNMTELGMGMDKYPFPWQKITEKIFYVEGSGFLIHRDLWFQLKGFDEDMVVVAEDIDLCWRAQLLGYTLKKVPNAIFYHFGGATLGGTNTVSDKQKNTYQTSLNKRYFGERNQLRAMLKNYSIGSLLRILPGYYFWKILEVGYLCVRGQWKIVGSAYFKAHWWNLRHLDNTLKTRREIQKQRKISDTVIRRNITPGNAKIDMFRKIGLPKLKSP